nr:DUF6468 domain-containing protein [Sphingomonas yunnanensis]
MRHAGLIEVVASLESATDTSQRALGELTQVLQTGGPSLDAAVRGARDLRAQLVTLRDELSLMIDIGNGVAERILAAANDARGSAGDARGMVANDAAAPKPESACVPAGRHRRDHPGSPGTAARALPGEPARAETLPGSKGGEVEAVTSGTGVPAAVVSSDDVREAPFSADMPLSAAAKDPQS